METRLGLVREFEDELRAAIRVIRRYAATPGVARILSVLTQLDGSVDAQVRLGMTISVARSLLYIIRREMSQLNQILGLPEAA